MSYSDRIAQLTELAWYDEGCDYEVDMGGIYLEEDRFILITASGCSCWDGDWDEDVFQSLEAIEEFFKSSDRAYRPTPAGAAQLIEDAKKKLYELAS